jgi:hypothetical protein
LLGGTVAAAFMLIGYGELASIDARKILDAGRQFVRGEFPTVHPTLGVKGSDGRSYPVCAPGNIIAMAPAVWLARLVSHMFGGALPLIALQEGIASLWGPLFKGVSAALSFLILQRLEQAPRRNLILALLACLIGHDFNYSRSYFVEPPVGVCLLWATLCLLSPGRTQVSPPSSASAGWAGLALATSITFRWDAVMYIPIFSIAAARIAPGPGARRRNVLTLLAPVAIVLILLGWYNQVRFGSPWHTGYREGLRPNPIGWAGLLFAPGAGILWFAPWTIALLKREKRGVPERMLRLLAMGSLATAVFWFGFSPHWKGDLAWGPRYLVPVVPLLALASLNACAQSRRWAIAIRTACAACILLNTCLVAAPFERLAAFAEVQGWSVQEQRWDPRKSPWLQQPRMALQVMGRLADFRNFSGRASTRLWEREEIGLASPQPVSRTIEDSAMLNLPAIWWLKLLLLSRDGS